jgi:hypothetical protein
MNYKPNGKSQLRGHFSGNLPLAIPKTGLPQCVRFQNGFIRNFLIGSLAVLILIAHATRIGAAPTFPVSHEFFGMTFYPGLVPPDFVGAVGTLGKMPNTRWVYVQPKSRTEFNWEGVDKQLADMRKLGLSHFIYSIDNPPGWAVANHAAGTGRINSITREWESYLQPDDMNDYTNFIHALLTRYPQINILAPFCEPQNEPIPVKTAIAMNRALIDYVHANFPGVKVGTPTLKPRDSDQQNISPGVWDFEYWKQGGPKDFDVLMWHGYPGIKVVMPSANTVERVASRREHMQALINYFGLQSKLVVDDESCWGTDGTASNNHTDAVAFVAQDLLMHFSFGDEIFVWYFDGPGNWGTLAHGQAVNPSGISWLQVKSWMLGSTLMPPGIGLNGVVRSGVWTRPGAYGAISVWTTDGSSLAFNVPIHNPPYRQYRDTAGNVMPITAGKVTISGRPIWIETVVDGK